MFRRLTEVAVGVVVAMLALRTFGVLGVVTPALVHGSSMAPAVWGEHIVMTCPECGGVLEVGAEHATGQGALICPVCRYATVTTDAGVRRSGDALWVDRTSLLHPIDRWRAVVIRCPHDARELCVKRVLGLPGETVALAEGDLWIDGARVAKSLDDQTRVRRLEHRETERARRWRPATGQWRREGDGWGATASPDRPPAVLRYERPEGGPVYDDFPGNARLTRGLNAVRDLMVALELSADSEAVIEVRLPTQATARLDLSNRTAELVVPNGADPARRSLRARPRRVLLSVFDRRAVLAVDGRVVLRQPAPDAGVEPHVAASLAVLAGDASFRDLTLWKDIYYEPDPQAPALAANRTWRLGPDEYFVVGDNQAVSVDSRRWRPGGVPQRLLVGRPIGLD